MAAQIPTLGAAFFAAGAVDVARDLIGVELSFGTSSGIIVETEAYTDDAASHYVIRRPSAGELMGSTHGRIYIYRIYGVYDCLNFTADGDGPGAVLIRALEPRTGIDEMRRRRGVADVRKLCSGPGKLASALGIDRELNGEPVTRAFELRPPATPPRVAAGPRIGITRAVDLPWRFTLRGSSYLSRRR